LTLQQWASGWNYPSWSISTEAEAYVYFVFFAGLLVTQRKPLFIASGCIFILIGLSVRNGGNLNCFGGTCALLRTLAEFSLGVVLYRVSLSNARLPHCRWSATSAVLLAGLAMVTDWDLLMVGAFGCLIHYCVKAPDARAGRLLNSRPAVALRNWSYSIYLWHVPTHYSVMAMLAAIGYPVRNLSMLSARMLIFATTLVVISLSAASYRYFETPVRRFILSRIVPPHRYGEPDRASAIARS
jgi:peptidoglycan/LPS O-acetylase OafA/YrhL